jgi:hypothetical protein
MKIKIKQSWHRYYWDLDPDSLLRVLEITENRFRVMNLVGRPFLYLKQAFLIIDHKLDDDWVIDKSGEGHPEALGSRVFEAFFEGDPVAVGKVRHYVNTLCRLEASSVSSQGIVFMRVNDGLCNTYSEVDKDGWEVRKVRVTEKGIDYADPIEESGELPLSKVDVRREQAPISASEFEEQWRRAQQAHVEDNGMNGKKLSSRELANLVVTSLSFAKLLDDEDLERAIGIVEEEIDARKGVGDY